MDLKIVSLFVAALLLGACGSDERNGRTSDTRSDPTEAYATGRLPTAESVQQRTYVPVDPGENQAERMVRRATLGRDVGPEGDISEAQRAEEFAPGESIQLAVEIAEPVPNTPLRVVWYGPDEMVLREDVKEISGQDKYVNFSAEESRDWDPGEYRAEIWVNDKKVSERRFAVISDRNRPAESSGG